MSFAAAAAVPRHAPLRALPPNRQRVALRRTFSRQTNPLHITFAGVVRISRGGGGSGGEGGRTPLPPARGALSSYNGTTVEAADTQYGFRTIGLRSLVRSVKIK